MAKNEIQDFLKIANKEFGENSAILLDDTSIVEVDVIPTGIDIIDSATVIGGIPRGRFTEVFGKEASGKTTLCMHTIASAQKMGLNVAFVDAEHSLGLDMMERLGIDTGKLVISQPDSGEEALNLIEMMVRSGKFALIVVDSVAALTPQVEIEKDIGEFGMGVHARLMSQAMRKLTAPVSKHNVALMFTNQTRVKIGGYVAGETTTGGNALKFYCSLRLKLQFIGQIKDSSGQRVSGKYRMTVVKSKLAVPFKIAEFEINERGIDGMGGLIDEFVEKGILTKAGAFYKLKDKVLAQGRRALIEKFHEEPDLVQKLHKQG